MKTTAFANLVNTFALLLFLPLAASAGEPNMLSDAEKSDGWQLLFDGKSAEHWRGYKADKIGEGWVIKEGTLARADGGAGDIITREQYESFDLILEFRISPGGNSGLMFGVRETDGPSYATGPEIQILDNAQGKDPQKTGWLYQLYRGEEDSTKPAGEWNEVRLKLVKGGTSTVWINGVKYYEFEQGSDDWNERVAKSKFAQMPQFGTFTKGHICLQDHGNEVAFRNIRIKKL